MHKVSELLNSIRGKENISVFGLSENYIPLAIRDLDSFIYVCKDLPTSLRAREAFSFKEGVIFLPPSFENSNSNLRQALENRLQRVRAIFEIATNKSKILITSLTALKELYPKREYILENIVSLSANQDINLTDLLKKLQFIGYKRVSQVSELGEFAVRGDIIDISPINLSVGIRLDFFDERIERIRLFDLESQLTNERINRIDIPPLDEIFYLGEVSLDNLADYPVIYCEAKACYDILPDIKSKNTMVTFDRFLCQNRIFNPQRVINFEEKDLAYFKDLEQEVRSSKQERQIVRDNKEPFFVPKIGEYVVHQTHGVGLCQGIKRMKMGTSERDYIVISYQGGDSLYVSAENTNLISAYLGEESPRLNKIGGIEFSKLKDKAKKAIKEMAFDLTSLYAKRESTKGHKYSLDNSALKEFDDDFIYKETPCQLTAEMECISDLTSGKVMDRLLCGDVGYGKTEVAMRVMFKVVLENKQCAFISPTTVLASQHYKTLKKRMDKFGVKIASLTRFNSDEEIKKALTELKSGRVDIVCGTHRILSKDVIFKDLGLLVLDEEQRFGVSDKEKIKLLKNDVNVLSLSATPIPRTLHMSMSGIRDISVLDTPPLGRIPVFTSVTAYSDDLLVEAVTREIDRKGQVFIIYNRVERIDSYAFSLTQLFPNLKIRVAHGQMSKNRLEDTINKFIFGEIDILVTSTIIENGIDMQNVNTMIVVESDKFGLSQLYQLRGRIGRGKKLAYAYFTFDENKALSENAYKRLDAITSYTEFGSGFKLAMRDLEIRGAGNILGSQQHGHMQKVGYDMYLKLIKEVMDEMKGETEAVKEEVKVITDFSAFIPDEYILDSSFRLKTYKKIAQIDSLEGSLSEIKQLENIYGNVPLEVKNLIYIALIKNLALSINAQKITLTKEKAEIKFINNEAIGIDLIKRATSEGFTYSLINSSLSFKPKADSNKKLLNFLLSSKKTT